VLPLRERLTSKPWGYEEVLIETEKYVVLRMFIRKGEETSLHKHVERDEHFIVVSGSGLLVRSGVSIPVREWDVVSVRSGELHKWVALEDLEVIEVTTHPLSDLVRVEDKYGRAIQSRAFSESSDARPRSELRLRLDEANS